MSEVETANGRPTLSLSELTEAGFRLSASWKLDEYGRPYLSGDMPKTPGVYLFSDGATVCYVGVTDRTLHKRMKPYSWRLKGNIPGRAVYNGIRN